MERPPSANGNNRPYPVNRLSGRGGNRGLGPLGAHKHIARASDGLETLAFWAWVGFALLVGITLVNVIFKVT